MATDWPDDTDKTALVSGNTDWPDDTEPIVAYVAPVPGVLDWPDDTYPPVNSVGALPGVGVVDWQDDTQPPPRLPVAPETLAAADWLDDTHKPTRVGGFPPPAGLCMRADGSLGESGIARVTFASQTDFWVSVAFRVDAYEYAMDRRFLSLIHAPSPFSEVQAWGVDSTTADIYQDFNGPFLPPGCLSSPSPPIVPGQIVPDTWYTFSAHVVFIGPEPPPTTCFAVTGVVRWEADWYLDGVLVGGNWWHHPNTVQHRSVGRLEAPVQTDPPFGGVEYADNVFVGTSGLFSDNIFSCDFEAGTIVPPFDTLIGSASVVAVP